MAACWQRHSPARGFACSSCARAAGQLNWFCCSATPLHQHRPAAVAHCGRCHGGGAHATRDLGCAVVCGTRPQQARASVGRRRAETARERRRRPSPPRCCCFCSPRSARFPVAAAAHHAKQRQQPLEQRGGGGSPAAARLCTLSRRPLAASRAAHASHLITHCRTHTSCLPPQNTQHNREAPHHTLCSSS